MFDLTGKVVLITGGYGLLGQMHAEAIKEAGGTPILADVESFGIDGYKCYHMDVTDKDSIQRVADSIERVDVLINNAALNPKMVTKGNNNFETFCLDSWKRSIQRVADSIERVDVLINNAALNPKMVTKGNNNFETFCLDSWKRSMDVNLTGAFLCSQIFINKMIKDGVQGSIINMSSDLGVIAPNQNIYDGDVKPVDYCVAKHGIIGLTKYIATYFADKGIRANSISPAGVYTDQPKEFVDRLTSLIPMGRMASKKDIKGATIFLSSDASSYMTGHNMILDGGRTIW